MEKKSKINSLKMGVAYITGSNLIAFIIFFLVFESTHEYWFMVAAILNLVTGILVIIIFRKQLFNKN